MSISKFHEQNFVFNSYKNLPNLRCQTRMGCACFWAKTYVNSDCYQLQIHKACQSLKRGYIERNNKAREVNCRNHRQRRGERSQGSARSNANNNRKCCWVLHVFMISRPHKRRKGTSEKIQILTTPENTLLTDQSHFYNYKIHWLRYVTISTIIVILFHQMFSQLWRWLAWTRYNLIY